MVTQDPAYTAKRMLRAAAIKPRTVHLGMLRGRKPQFRLLGATIHPDELVASCPQERIAVTADMQQDTLAATLVAVWARLAKQVAA